MDVGTADQVSRLSSSSESPASQTESARFWLAMFVTVVIAVGALAITVSVGTGSVVLAGTVVMPVILFITIIDAFILTKEPFEPISALACSER